VTEIYANRQGNVRKAPWYSVIEASAGGANSIHAEIDRKVHTSHRRVMEHAFTDKSLRASQGFFLENVQTFCDVASNRHDKEWSEPFNMSQWSTYLTYDIMGDLVFGRRFGLMTSNAHRFVPKLIMNSTAFIYTVCQAIALQMLVHGRKELFLTLLLLPVRIHASQSHLPPYISQWRAQSAHYWWDHGEERQEVF
jgi:cytochrome P450